MNNTEIVLLYEEIKKAPLKDIEKSQIQNSCVAFILLKKRKIHPIKCCSFCCKDKIIKTKSDADKLFNHYYKVVLIYVIVVPICFLIIAVLNRRAVQKTTPRTVISIIKVITTMYCFTQLINFVKNIENCIKDYGLVRKFFCIKVIIWLVVLQSVILGFITIETEEHSSSEMQEIINYFMLNIENCLLGFLWIHSYGYYGLRVEKYKNLKQKPSSNAELLEFKDGLNKENHQL